MRIAPLLAASVFAALLVGGCAALPDENGTPEPTVTSTPTTPEPAPLTPVDPAGFATQHGSDGVDFDSPDRNVRCGIWKSYEHYGFSDTATVGPLAGCRPLEADYATDPSTDPTGNVGCSGGLLFGDLPAEPVCNNGQVFVGEDPSTYRGSSPAPTATPTPDGPVADDPADYPIDGPPGFGGVQFTLADGLLRCAIFDPAAGNEFQARPDFGCVVSAADFPYPPITGGPMDSANAFLSSGHQPARETTVTDSTFGGSAAAAALAAGHSLTWSTVTCEALADDDVQCIDADSGHGMRVSVRDYEIF